VAEQRIEIKLEGPLVLIGLACTPDEGEVEGATANPERTLTCGRMHLELEEGIGAICGAVLGKADNYSRC
jgi:hypothetical protein